jgi:hypothetical protein
MASCDALADDAPQLFGCLDLVSGAAICRRRAANWTSPMSTALNVDSGELHVEVMGRGYAWLDTGTDASLIEAALYVQIIEQRQGLRIAWPSVVDSFRPSNCSQPAKAHDKSGYGRYLRAIYDSEAKGG